MGPKEAGICEIQKGKVVYSMYAFGYSLMYLQMKLGFARLQATWRARILTRNYRRMRRRVYLFQTRCRGMLARREFKRRLRSIIKIQSGVRKVLAIRKVHEMRLEVSFLLSL